MDIKRLLRSKTETPLEYRRRILALSSITPTIHLDVSEANRTAIKLAAEGDSVTYGELIEYFQTDLGGKDFLAVYQLGMIMLMNPIQLKRFSQTLEESDQLRRLIENDDEISTRLDAVFDARLIVLEDKAERARRIIEDYKGSEENPHQSDVMQGMRTSGAELSEIRRTRTDLIQFKTAALNSIQSVKESLRKILDFERKSNNA